MWKTSTTTVTLNGGKNVCIKDGKITVDGVEIDTGNVESDLTGFEDLFEKTRKKRGLTIQFTGPVESLVVHGSLSVDGDVVGNVKSTSISCGDISGNVECATLNCGDVGGNVAAKIVNCGDVGGDVIK